MPVELLSESERVKLSRFPEEILPEDLRRHFTPQEGKWAYGLSWALSPGPLHLNLIRHSWRIHLIAVLFQRRALGDAETVDGVIRASNAKPT